MVEIEQYSYLWNGSEPGWVLVRTSRQEVSLTLFFEEPGPSLNEAKAIRALVPAFKHQPASTLLKTLKGLPELHIGTFDMKEGRDLSDLCRRHNLNVKAVSRDMGSDVLVNEITMTTLVIEGEALSKAVCQAALLHGLRIRYVEA